MSKTDSLRSEFKSVSTRSFNRLNEADTTKTKKYLERLLWWYTNKTCKLNDLIQIPVLFETYLPHIDNKDIYSRYYDDPSKVFEVIDLAKFKKENKNFSREENVDVLMENDDLLLIRPLTSLGSQRYGYNTKWCTTETNTFEDYSSSGELFYLIYKSSDIKYAFFIENPFSEMEVYCQHDDRVELKNIMDKIGISFSLYKKLNTLMYNYVIDKYEKKITEKEIEKFKKCLLGVNTTLLPVDDMIDIINEFYGV